MRFADLKLAVAPTRRTVFSREDSLRYKKLVEDQLRQWKVNTVDLSGVNDEGLLVTLADAEKAAAKFKAAGADALFVPHCNFGSEDAVGKVAKLLGVPVLLWGPRDEAPLPDGTRLRDTQCGLFATSKILRRLGIPFTYIVNSRLDDPVFERGVRNFLAVANVVKAFRRLRIGQVGLRPAPFWTVMCNEAELLEKFGIEIVPLPLAEVVEEVRGMVASKPTMLRDEMAALQEKVSFGDSDENTIARIAGFKLALEKRIRENALSALAVQCWSALQTTLGISACFVHGEITGDGYPVACETDIHGAISSVLLQAARFGETPTFFADLTIRHPGDDNAELLWHCGPFPLKLIDDEAEKQGIGGHYILPGVCRGVSEWRIKGGPISIARFDGERGDYSLLIGHAEGTKGPKNRGTYVWIKVKDWPMWEEKVIYGPYIHHVAGIHGHVAPVLYEACKYIGIKPDLVEPTEAEVRAWLRGR